MCFNKRNAISLNGKTLKLENRFIYLGSTISSTECDFNIYINKARTTTDRLMIIRKSDLADKIKRKFFQVVAVIGAPLRLEQNG